MSRQHQQTHGGIVVNEGPESSIPSKFNVEGQNANHTDSAGEALAGPPRSRSVSQTHSQDQDHDEKEKSVGQGGKPHMEKYAYHFFSPEMVGLRKVVFKILVPGLILTIIVMWACLPFYWGSLWKSNHYTDKLTVRVINRDEGVIGQTVSSFLLEQTNLGYFYTSPSELPTVQAIEHDIVQEGAWATVEIIQGASSFLETSRANGASSYNASSLIQVYYAQARNELATGNYLVPYLQQILGRISGQIGVQLSAQYLQNNAGNQTAMNLLAQAPSTIVQPVYFTLNNLRPYNQPVAQAITLVGAIYLLIFSFIVTMILAPIREMISPFMTTRAYLAFRLIVPPTIYLLLGLLFAMVTLPFKAHFGAHYTYAGGFFLWAFTVWLGMCALGLSLEFAITIIGPKFMGFFLVALIIANVSVASQPHELQPWIYRYGVAMPFHNVGQAVRTIIFDTKNQVAQNLGILLAWAVFSLCTITLATWLMRRKSVNEHKRTKQQGV